jgi:hypothetical protein
VLTREQVEQVKTPYDRDPYADSGKSDAFRAYRGNRALASAFRKGALAAIEGEKLTACPYADWRTYRGGVTFSRAFQRAWGEGWHFATYDGDRTACRYGGTHTGRCKFTR